MFLAPAFPDKFTIRPVRQTNSESNVSLYLQRPIQVHLFGSILPGCKIVQPLPINIEKDGEKTFIVSDDIFLVYGEGEDESSAINDYLTSLSEFYDLVKRDAAENPHDRQQLGRLETYMEKGA